MGLESLMLSDLTLGPSFKVKQGKPNFKVLITRLLLVLEVCNVNQLKGNHGLGIFLCGHIWLWAPPFRSNIGSLALMSFLSGGYKFASVLRCPRSSLSSHTIFSLVSIISILSQNRNTRCIAIYSL